MKLLRRMIFNRLPMCAILMLISAGPALATQVLVLHSDIKELNQVAGSIKEQLSAEFKVQQHKFSDKVEQAEFDGVIKKSNPDLLILFDNTLLNMGARYNKSNNKKIPLISIMSLNLKEAVKSEANATGVAYEVPPFLLVTSFNKIIESKAQKIGVIYRKELFDWYIKEAKDQLKYEKIEVIDVAIDTSGDADNIGDKIKSTLATFKKDKIDAFWLVSDNAIINQKTMSILRDYSNKSRVPLLCGVKKLAEHELNLCSFAVTPDNDTMIEQSIDQALSILKDNLPPSELKVEYLDRVNKIVNLEKLEGNGVNVRKDQLEDIEVSK